MFRGYLTVLVTAFSNVRHQGINYLSAVATIAIVMVILVGFTAIGTSFNRIVSNTGSETIAILLQTGASSEGSSSIVISDLPVLQSVLSEASDLPHSPELLMILSTQAPDGTEARVSLRGMDKAGLAFHNGIQADIGSLFALGSDQIAIGVRAASSLGITRPGQSITLGRASWIVSGIFSDGGSIYESEIWASRDTMSVVYNRSAAVQSVRVHVDDTASLEKIKNAITADPRISLSVTTEKAYFKSSAGNVGDIIFYIGWPLALVMAVGALTSAINTISASVAVRSHHLGTLRASGVRPGAVCWGVMSEALIQALLGAIIGGLAASTLLSGFEVSTVGEGFSRISFDLQINRETLTSGLILCVGIGLLSGLVPALKIARGNVSRLLNES